MNDPRFWAAVAAVAMASLSLGWQIATYLLTGSRVKVWLRVGASNGHTMVTAEPKALSPEWTKQLAEQGYGQPVAAVRVANVGRQPVTVERWGLKSPLGVSMYPVADSIGPKLPHRLEVGESETWAVDMRIADWRRGARGRPIEAQPRHHPVAPPQAAVPAAESPALGVPREVARRRPLRSTAMNDPRFWVAVVAAMLASASLAWQAATHVLTGGRVKVWLRVGAIGGCAMVSARPKNLAGDWAERYAEQGYPRPVVVVQVANVGRQPVTVARWGVRSATGVTMHLMEGVTGPDLPLRLEVGESETWTADAEDVVALVRAAQAALRRDPPQGFDLIGTIAYRAAERRRRKGVAAVAELATGRTRRSRDTLR